MAIDYKAMAQQAMTLQDDPLSEMIEGQQMDLMRRQNTQSDLVRSRAILATARMPHKNPYDNLTPEQPSPQAVYSQGEASEMSQWKGVK